MVFATAQAPHLIHKMQFLSSRLISIIKPSNRCNHLSYKHFISIISFHMYICRFRYYTTASQNEPYRLDGSGNDWSKRSQRSNNGSDLRHNRQSLKYCCRRATFGHPPVRR